MIIGLCAAALVLNGVSAYLLTLDPKSQEERRGKPLVIFGILMTLCCMGIAIALPIFNEDHSFLFNLKRICLLSLLWPAAYIDYKSYRIPNILIVMGLMYRALIFALELFFESGGIWQRTLPDLVAAAALALAALICGLTIKNSIGFGDVKLFIIMGLMLGLDGIWSSILVSLVISFVISIILMALKKKSRKDAIPFAPSIMLGTYISVLITGM